MSAPFRIGKVERQCLLDAVLAHPYSVGALTVRETRAFERLLRKGLVQLASGAPWPRFEATPQGINYARPYSRVLDGERVLP